MSEDSPLNAPAEVAAEQYLNNYREKYRIRAAIALGRIGGSEAVSALRAAEDNPAFRQFVRNAARQGVVRIQAQVL